MSRSFTHLHLHTDFSLLDGAIKLDDLVAFGVKQKWSALAMTDHGNIFGAVKFFQKCKKAGIKPIIGMEAYFCEDIAVKSAEKKYYHLVLLVQNEVGYRNLCKLLSHAYQEGFYFKPRIDYKLLERYSEGLIASTACLGGHIPSLLMAEQYDQAEERARWFLDRFGHERFYFEIAPEEQDEQKILNQRLKVLGEQLGVSLVAAGDCHYLTPEDREAHEVMLAIQTQRKMTDTDRFTFGEARVHVRTAQEMVEALPLYEQAVWNSGVFADRCSFEFKTGELYFPRFQIPQEHSEATYFDYLCDRGFQALCTKGFIPAQQVEEYKARLDLEKQLIKTMGFVGYFLVVGDLIQWAKRNNIPVGPGRGSAAGSLVAWALEITNIDPIKYNLLFERFLNPERVSMPDIDIDFCIEGRERVIQYARDRYGSENVGQIITFGTMLAKGVVKDVARALGVPFDDAQMITGLIPEQLKITLEEAISKEPRLKELVENNQQTKQIFDIAFRLEGITRHASKHAAGIVISPRPISEVLPVYVPPKTTELVTQYAMTELETLGFLKIDLLGLQNLTVIKRTVEMIAQTRGIMLDIDLLPLDDKKTFELLSAGKTSGVFQLESEGLKEVLRKLQPERFEDIIAVNALYRPGPLGSGMVDDFIARRHGKQQIEYLFPELAEILQETYGVIVYQEQVMKIASLIGGYSLGEADILRRAMGKKKADVMAEQRALFFERAVQRGFDGKKAGELFDLMAYFAGYGFNKSHSAAYALIAYQTAYLKAHFAPEFLAAILSLEAGDAETVSFYLKEAKECGIKLIPPHINKSHSGFSVVDGAILFGLHGIKNVGEAAIKSIIAEREKKPFQDIYDFCLRVDLRTVNKRVLEHLICAGAFDSLGQGRAQLFEHVGELLDQMHVFKKQAETGQMSLFGAMQPVTADTSASVTMFKFRPVADWDNKTILEKEAESIGFFLSAHPLDPHQPVVEGMACVSIQSIADGTCSLQGHVIVAGFIASKKIIFTKKQDRMAFLQLEDRTGTCEVVVFPKLFKKIEQWLDSHHVFVVKGEAEVASGHAKIKADECIPVELLMTEASQVRVTIAFAQEVPTAQLQELPTLLLPGNAECHLVFYDNGKRIKVAYNKKIKLSVHEIKAIKERFNARVTITL